MNWLSGTLEYQSWGMNAATIGFIGTVIFTLVEGGFTWRQVSGMWRAKSAEAIAPIMFIYASGSFVSAFIYGVSVGSLALMMNGLLVMTQLPIVYGIAKFGTLQFRHWLMLACIVVLLAIMAATDVKAEFFLFGSIGTIASILSQPMEMYRLKKVGVLQVGLVWAYTVATTFWLVYSFAVRDVPLMILTPCYLAGFAWIILLYYRYRTN